MRTPVIYVHGFIGHLRFTELTTGLDPADVWMPDLLGFGAYAGTDPSQMSVALQSHHLATWIERYVGTMPAVLVGHSAGAAVVMRYAKTHHPRVAAVVSAEGNLAPGDAFLCSRIAPMLPNEVECWLSRTRRDPASLLATNGHRLPHDALDRLRDCLNHQPAHVVHAAARATLLETLNPGYALDVQSVMSQIPTFLVRGEHTSPALEASARIRALARGSFTIADAGHAMVLENPEFVAHVVSQIVSRIRESTFHHPVNST